jgi:hypothetical protein
VTGADVGATGAKVGATGAKVGACVVACVGDAVGGKVSILIWVSILMFASKNASSVL